VCEATKRLALENLVTVFPRRGTFASEINITDLAHISDVRQQLEGHAAYRAAERLTPARREELETLLRRIDGPDGASPDELMELDAQIHRFVHRCTANPYLEETLARYFNLSLRIWYLVLDRLPHLTERVREHRALLEAIRDGDAQRARRIAAEHVGTFATEIRSVL
jgi:DNA-binding GntR family transcriptional regulator